MHIHSTRTTWPSRVGQYGAHTHLTHCAAALGDGTAHTHTDDTYKAFTCACVCCSSRGSMTIRFTQRMRLISYLYLETLETMGKTSFLKDSFRWPRKLFAFFAFFEQIKFPLYTRKQQQQCNATLSGAYLQIPVSVRVCVCACVSEHISRRDLGTDFSQSPT